MAGKSHYFHLGVFPWPADGNGADGITGNVVTVITGRMEQWPSGPEYAIVVFNRGQIAYIDNV